MKYFVVMIAKPHMVDKGNYAYCVGTDKEAAIKERDRRIEMYDKQYNVHLTVEVT